MIIPEHILRDKVVAEIEAIYMNPENTLSPKFGWGDKKELDRWLLTKAKEDGGVANAYPLIWLLPSVENHIRRGVLVQKDCEFIIATLEDNKDLFNDQRYIKSFDTVLNPLTESFIKKLALSRVSEPSTEWEIFKHPNYSESDKNGTIDLWDAIKLDISIKFTEC